MHRLKYNKVYVSSCNDIYLSSTHHIIIYRTITAISCKHIFVTCTVCTYIFSTVITLLNIDVYNIHVPYRYQSTNEQILIYMYSGTR